MKVTQFLAAVCFAALLVVAVVPSARADTMDQETVVRFNHPVEVPGTVLPAGKYVFQLAPLMSTQDVVQVWNPSRTRLITTIVGIPAERMDATGKPIFTLERLGSGNPEALEYWYYAGELDGLQFTYPSNSAVQEAHVTHPTAKSHKG